MNTDATPPRSLLYVPGSNARALEKAQGLAADLLIIDLEDAVPADRKIEAREAMRRAVEAGYPGKRIAVRVNATGSWEQEADITALYGLALDAVVLPKVDAVADLDPVRALGVPILAMIETPVAIYAARDIAADPAVVGLIAGLNDLAHELKLPDGMDRSAMSVAIQTIVLAARAAGVWAFDGVY
uniref:HpcH/HpaI aldolase/citrate lyase family protein n=1 Tax=Sphingopyxis sp. TaxID=1908224 RepID=UPI0035B103A3